MFSKLRAEFPEEHQRFYWHHNSGGEHAQKHLGDSWEINEIRVRRGLEPYDYEVMYNWLLAGGLVVVRNQFPQGGAGSAAGYLIADKTSPGKIVIQDVYVEEPHRNRGIGGYVVGTLLSRVRFDDRGPVTVADYGRQLVTPEREFLLPGAHVEAYAHQLGDNKDKFLSSVPPGWSGIQSVVCDERDQDIHRVYRHGQVVAEIDRQSYGEFYIHGGDTVYEHIVFAAAAAINGCD